MLRSFLPVLLLVATAAWGEETPVSEDWSYAQSMQRVASSFKGRAGVVLHIGDSITYASPYGQWALGGKGRSERELEALKWMHLGAEDETDGWWLARVDLPAGRSYTAAGGLRMDQLLAGTRDSHPKLETMLSLYQPQVAVLMLGTNDVSADRKNEEFRRDAERAVDAVVESGCICILSTIPPHPGNVKLSGEFNEALRKIAASRKLPLIDYEREILKRRPEDWNGTLMNKDDPHPSASFGDATATSEPTAENLRNSGYLLRSWLSVKKIAEVKEKVIDAAK